jgi:hypothetical protein
LLGAVVQAARLSYISGRQIDRVAKHKRQPASINFVAGCRRAMGDNYDY